MYYETAVAILVIVTSGRYLEAKSRATASKVIDELENSVPKTATKIHNAVDPKLQISLLVTGETLILRPGDVIPVDVIIRAGSSSY